jgi:zinc transporter, ZIP family
MRPGGWWWLPRSGCRCSPAGTVLGAWLLSGASPTVLAAVLAFGAVAFMYLATEELLVEAHERGETAAGSVTFFVGFLLYMVLSETIG